MSWKLIFPSSNSGRIKKELLKYKNVCSEKRTVLNFDVNYFEWFMNWWFIQFSQFFAQEKKYYEISTGNWSNVDSH